MTESRGRGRGRRPGAPDTRAAILASAKALFADNGFSGTSLRAVATGAGVDAALVHHYFASKEDLFVAALAPPVDPREVFALFAGQGPEGAGERLIRGFLSVWDDPALQVSMIAFARGLFEPSAAAFLREGFLQVVILPLGEALGVDEPERRMPLVASQVIGIVMLRYLVGVEPLASMPAEQVVEIYAPTLQRYLTGPLPS